jgi:hypothetical protein
MRRILFIFTLVIIASAALAAAEFWEAKPFLQWSDREVEKVLTDSPWTALVAIPLPNRGPVPSADAGGGGRGGGGEGGGGRGGGDFGPAAQRVRLTISWRSALPLREAIARQQAGKTGTIAPDVQAKLEHDDDHYWVAIQGLPPQYTRPGPNNSLQGFLRRGGKPAIGATQGAAQMTRGGALLLVGFPRTDPITLEDNDVEFDVKLGPLEIKKKFKLKDMLFAGKLAL